MTKQEAIDWLKNEVDWPKKLGFNVTRSFYVTELEEIIKAIEEDQGE